METTNLMLKMNGAVHTWLYPLSLSCVPGPMDPLLEEFTQGLISQFTELGHKMLDRPEEGPDVLLTTGIFNQPVSWRESLFFTARRRYRLERYPTVFNIVHITPSSLQAALASLGNALSKENPGPEDYPFPGLTPKSYHTLHEQGRRGGPILSAVRLLQAQTKCVRILLVVGDEHPLEAYTFDLVGGHPRTIANDPKEFYTDLALRIATAVCTREITDHEVVDDPIPDRVWQKLSTPSAMLAAGKEFGTRSFFTEMVSVANLVAVPVFDGVISSQYSEGCYSTWDPDLGALITTVTGSARPIDKGHLTENELAVIVSARPDGRGARIRHVEGKPNDPPSSEAVELIEMDSRLPRLSWDQIFNHPSANILAYHPNPDARDSTVPVVRSKLHGHRSVRSYDPRRVEHVFLDKPYYHYPVSCSTEAQANAIQTAFSRSEALNNPTDSRQIVFTVLPGHGMVVVEKWVPHKAPFQIIWEMMDAGALEISNLIPQGPLMFKPDSHGRMNLEEI
jgi:hypothetical protein